MDNWSGTAEHTNTPVGTHLARHDVFDVDNIRRSVSGGDSSFQVRMDAQARLSCSFQRSAFTPITMSHRVSNPSPRTPGARL